jgi:hypothetical protein
VLSLKEIGVPSQREIGVPSQKGDRGAESEGR